MQGDKRRIAAGLAVALMLTVGTAAAAINPPLTQKAKLKASNGRTDDGLGYSVAISGKTMVASARGHGKGVVYVFRRPAGGWANATQIAKLKASDAADNTGFGESVAISGDTVIVGAPFAGSSGSAYVYERPASGWANATEDGKLTPAAANTFDFGRSVAVSGDSAFVGAEQSTINGHAEQGAAFAFVRPGTGWTNSNETAKLFAATGAANDFFGRSVAIFGDTVAIGAPGRNVAGNTPNRGMVYVFVAPAGPNTWKDDDTADGTLVASEGAESDFLGFSVAISGPTIVAGAMQDDVGSNNVQGSGYVFERGAAWADGIESAKLLASDGDATDRLGYSVAIHGDAVVLGSAGHDVGTSENQGAAYLYVKPPTGWLSASPLTESQELVAPDGREDDAFALSVAVSGNSVAAGVPADKTSGNAGQGSARAFGSP